VHVVSECAEFNAP